MATLIEMLSRTPTMKMEAGQTYKVYGLHGFSRVSQFTKREENIVVLHTDKGHRYAPSYIVRAAEGDAGSDELDNVLSYLYDALHGRELIAYNYTTKQGKESLGVTFADPNEGQSEEVNPFTGEVERA